MTSAINLFSQYLSNEVKLSKDLGENGEVFAYSILILLINITALGGIAIAAWLLGTLKTTSLIWVTFFSLRIFTGGRHQAGPVKCWFLTVTVFTVLGLAVTHLARLAMPFATLIEAMGLIFVLYTVIAYAPVTIASKKFKLEKRKTFKMAAVTVVIMWAAIVLNPAAAASGKDALLHLAIVTGLIAQSIAILPFSLNSKDKTASLKKPTA